MGNLIKETPYSEIKATLEVLQSHGVAREHLELIRKDPARASVVAQTMIAGYVVKPTFPTFPLTLDHSLSRKEMIQAGNYDWVNNNITEKRFPRDKREGKEKVDLELIHLNKYTSSEAVLSELKKRGYRPSTLSELLAFGSTYKDEQRKYPIVALGSTWQHWHGPRRVPCLSGWHDGRDMDLSWFGRDWHGHFRFLAVRESIPV